MRSVRLSQALVACAAILVSFSGATAGAGAPTVSGSTSCVTTGNGDFDITITINNLISQEGDLAGGWDTVTTEGEGPGDNLVFDPATLPANGSSSATFTVPSNTITVGGQVVVTYPDAPDTGYLIDGTGDISEICGEPETTTTSTTAAPSTTTPAAPAAAAAAAAQPRFTG